MRKKVVDAVLIVWRDGRPCALGDRLSSVIDTPLSVQVIVELDNSHNPEPPRRRTNYPERKLRHNHHGDVFALDENVIATDWLCQRASGS